MKQLDNITWEADDNKCFIEIETQKVCGLYIQLGKIYQTNIDDTIDRYTEIDLTDEIKKELGINDIDKKQERPKRNVLRKTIKNE